MYYLIFSICFSASLPLLFKFFESKGIKTSYVVPINYFACAVVGIILGDLESIRNGVLTGSWLLFAAIQGLLLAVNFYLLAATAQRVAVSVAALSSRMSVAIPVAVAFFLYGDAVTPVKLVALVAAGLSLFLASTNSENGSDGCLRSNAILPAMTFLSYGANWTLLKYVQHFYLDENMYHPYVTVTFVASLAVGGLLAWIHSPHKRLSWDTKTVVGGSVLGVCNYFAVYFLVVALSVPGWESSRVYPTYGVGVIMVSSLYAFLFMGERSSVRRLAGLLIGLVTIILMNI